MCVLPICVRLDLVYSLYVLYYLQIARDCPEGREPVEEEDNTWGEVEDPWSGDGVGTFVAADGN